MSERKPAADWFDAMVDFAALRGGDAFAYGLIKLTYSFAGTATVLAEPEPLLHDLRDETASPRLHAGTDFWPVRPGTDFVVRGAAYARDGSAGTMTVSASIGDVTKDVAVFGDRVVEWTNAGQPRIGAPASFEMMPLTWQNAYGGLDWRVAVENADDPVVAMTLQTDHPGMYPRNPFGKGYLVERGRVDGMPLPNLEDPADLLTPDRLVTGDPRLWWRQPLPWCFDWAHPATFPRYVYLGMGVDAWHPGPQDDAMPEVRRGFLAAGYRDRLRQRSLEDGPDAMFHQGGSHGFVLPRVQGSQLVRLSGMHPDRPLQSFWLPEGGPPAELGIEGQWHAAAPELYSIVCYPDRELFTVLYRVAAPLTRAWVRGVHRDIPLALRVAGRPPIHYDAPTPALAKLDQANRASEAP